VAYALGECHCHKKGYIYVLSKKLLRENRVEIYRVADYAANPSIPEDDEHILVAFDCGEIPSSTIISMEEITS
jgi:hypothetical protein